VTRGDALLSAGAATLVSAEAPVAEAAMAAAAVEAAEPNGRDGLRLGGKVANDGAIDRRSSGSRCCDKPYADGR
jgi:hypothetical protein